MRRLLVPAIFTLVVCAILVGLGVWQMQRLAWKENLIAEVTTRMVAAPVAAPGPIAWPGIDWGSVEYQPVTVSGHYLNDHEVHVIYSLTSPKGPVGGVGYMVVTPFVTDSSWVVYVNRGFVPTEKADPATRAEGEIAFVLAKELKGPGVTPEDVLAATAYVQPCFEIVDSRIRDWKITISDTVADNASSGVFLVGADRVDPRKVDFVTCGMVVWKNGEVISTGAGAAAVGTPVGCVAWLANTLGSRGIPLEAGEVILSGSLVPLEPVRAGDEMEVRIAGIGSARVRFT